MSNAKRVLPPTGSVAKRLFYALYTKAVKAVRNKPLLVDKVAAELVDPMGHDFDRNKNPLASPTGVARRAAYFDEVARAFLAAQPQSVVVVVGCGLDARVQRLGCLASKGMFYQLDKEEVMAARQLLLPPAANERYVSASVLSTGWMDELRAAHPVGNLLFLIEGIRMYFTEADNQFLFRELTKRFAKAEIHF